MPHATDKMDDGKGYLGRTLKLICQSNPKGKIHNNKQPDSLDQIWIQLLITVRNQLSMLFHTKTQSKAITVHMPLI